MNFNSACPVEYARALQTTDTYNAGKCTPVAIRHNDTQDIGNPALLNETHKLKTIYVIGKCSNGWEDDNFFLSASGRR